MPSHSRIIVGIGGSNHDFSACLCIDGQITVAIEEERITRLKRGYGGVPRENAALYACLAEAGLTMRDIQAVYVNDLLNTIKYPDVQCPIHVVGHHLCHAASAFYASDFPSAAVLIMDHSGGRYCRDGRVLAETLSLYAGQKEQLSLLHRLEGEDEELPVYNSHRIHTRGQHGIAMTKKPRNSLGRFYARIAKLCGCVTRMGDGELHTESGKLMGLSAYGDERYHAKLSTYVQMLPNGNLSVSLGQPGLGLENFCVNELTRASNETDLFTCRAGLAWAAQRVLEDAIVHCAQHALERVGGDKLCLAGGVMLNGLANHRVLERTKCSKLFVQPAAHDAGTAIGAAYIGSIAYGTPIRRKTSFSAYLGRRFSDSDIHARLCESQTPHARLEHGAATLSKLLAARRIVGLFQGRAEIGPRALGNRSILANVCDPQTKSRLNNDVKFREPYRPYAPVVRASDCDRYFDLLQDSPHMLLIGYIKPEWRERLCAISHPDHTARVQTVDEGDNALLSQVLEHLYHLTGVGVMLNTSMNVMGEPIVDSPEDAVQFLQKTRVDGLVIGSYLATRTDHELEHLLTISECEDSKCC